MHALYVFHKSLKTNTHYFNKETKLTGLYGAEIVRSL